MSTTGNISKSIDMSNHIEEKLGEFKLELLQSSTLKQCKAVSTIDREVLDKIVALKEMLDEKESNGEDHTVSKGLIEVFLREWNIITLGE